jgi:hypothetical protein
MARWPTLPDPGPDPSAWQELLRSAKQILEMVTGQRAGAPVAIMRLYKSDVQPGAANSPVSIRDLQDGDVWMNPASSYKLNFWDTSKMAWIPTT